MNKEDIKKSIETIIFLLDTEEGEILDPVDYEEAMFHLNALKESL